MNCFVLYDTEHESGTDEAYIEDQQCSAQVGCIQVAVEKRSTYRYSSQKCQNTLTNLELALCPSVREYLRDPADIPEHNYISYCRCQNTYVGKH